MKSVKKHLQVTSIAPYLKHLILGMVLGILITLIAVAYIMRVDFDSNSFPPKYVKDISVEKK